MSAEERAAEVLAAHEHEYERRVSPSHYCSCGEWDGSTGDDGGPNDGYNDNADAYRAHVAANLAAAGLLADRANAERDERLRAAVEALAVCEQPHGGDGNAATVYGHHGSRRICMRLHATDEWVYDPAWETVR